MKKLLAFLLIIAIGIGVYYYFTKNADNDKKLGELFDDNTPTVQGSADNKTDKADKKEQSTEEPNKEDYVFPEAEKQKLVEKITEKKAEISEEKELSFDDVVVQTYQVSAERQEMEEKRLGAMTIAELNRIYFGI